jgi:deoxyribonuclease (pyrimidine dimer)
MTRINCVPPPELTNKHLVAEYHELPRIFGMMRRWHAKGWLPGDRRSKVPEKFTLGTGHMTFFIDKGAHLIRRQSELIAEMQKRGMKPRFTTPATLSVGLSAEFMGEWSPDARARMLSRARIAERLAA